MYDLNTAEKRPTEGFTRIARAHHAAITSLAYDPASSVVLSGSADGCLALWSVEGRCVERLDKISNKQVGAVLGH